MPKVFISHSSKNRRRAERLANALKKRGVDVWYDEWDMLVGHNLADQIYEGIRSSDYLAVILTKAAITSRWVKEELDLAKVDEIENRGTKIIPLLYERCDIPYGLRTKVYADFTSFTKGFDRLMKLLAGIPVQASGLEAAYSLDDILGPLHVCRKLALLFAHCIPILEGKDPRTVLSELQEDVNLLTSLANRFEVDPRCVHWLEDFYSVFEAGKATGLLSSTCVEERREIMYCWIRGTVLFRGGLTHRLPVVPRVALEVGKQFMPYAEWDEYSIWRNTQLHSELSLSQDFRKLVRKHATLDTIRSAFAMELIANRESKRTSEFVRKRIITQGIMAGFYSLLILGHIPFPKEWNDHVGSHQEAGAVDLRASFKHMAETVAEYILGSFFAFDECKILTDMIPEVTCDDYDLRNADTFERLMDLQNVLYRLSSGALNEIPGKAFCLGSLIGKLSVLQSQGIQIGEAHVLTAERIITELDVAKSLTSQLKTVFNEAYYGRPTFDENVPVELARRLCASFLSGKSGGKLNK